MIFKYYSPPEMQYSTKIAVKSKGAEFKIQNFVAYSAKNAGCDTTATL
jgi:hypothetical protein